MPSVSSKLNIGAQQNLKILSARVVVEGARIEAVRFPREAERNGKRGKLPDRPFFVDLEVLPNRFQVFYLKIDAVLKAAVCQKVPSVGSVVESIAPEAYEGNV